MTVASLFAVEIHKNETGKAPIASARKMGKREVERDRGRAGNGARDCAKLPQGLPIMAGDGRDDNTSANR